MTNTIPTCPVCGKPAHATETDDDNRHPECQGDDAPASDCDADDAPAIVYPDASDLDTGGWSDESGYHVTLYLNPETEPPRIEIHAGVGNIGWPMRAYHGRWLSIGGYGPRVDGESVLERLHAIESVLVEAAAAYEGTRWDGNNHRGQWADDSDCCDITYAWQDGPELRCYWDAWDWFGAAGVYWPDLAAEAGIDPERALGDDWESVADAVADAVEPLQTEQVSGTRAYAREVAERWRDEQCDEDA